MFSRTPGEERPSMRKLQRPGPARFSRRPVANAAALLGGIGLFCAAPRAGAVVVAGDPGQNALIQTSAPAGFEDAWDRVGSLGAGSGVYLGNGFVLSARHVNGGSTFTIDGTIHQRIAGTSVTLANPTGLGLSTQSDLWLNRYAVPDSSPLHGLGLIAIRDTPLAGAGTGAVMIGEGLGQTTQTPVNVGGSRTGYVWGGSEVRRWGDTIISTESEVSASGRDVVGAASFSFQQIAGRGNAAAGDSGGGLFFMGPEGPVLSGIIHAVTLFNDQNDDTAAFGNRTLFSDLSAYLDQIRVVEGDLDGDGLVGVSDLDLVLTNWGGSVTAGDWTQGDGDGDGLIGQGDLDLVLAHFGAGEPVVTQIPEPGSLGLLLLACWSGMGRRRR